MRGAVKAVSGTVSEVLGSTSAQGKTEDGFHIVFTGAAFVKYEYFMYSRSVEASNWLVTPASLLDIIVHFRGMKTSRTIFCCATSKSVIPLSEMITDKDACSIRQLVFESLQPNKKDLSKVTMIITQLLLINQQTLQLNAVRELACFLVIFAPT